MEPFDLNRVHWEKGKFNPWYLNQEPFLLRDLKLNQDEELVIVELSQKRYGFRLREVIYHHIVQSKLNGEDFIITFCGVCNAGVVLNPIINGKVHHFSETGVYNGQQIFEDVETGTLWNHLTGEALHGQLLGTTLSYIGPLFMTTCGEEALKNPRLPVFISGEKKFYRTIMGFVIKVILGKQNKNWLPPHFQKTLPALDPALPKMTMGLAVKIGGTIRFYPKELIQEQGIYDTIHGTKIHVTLDNKIPRAIDESGNHPFQLFTRWYAFRLTYPQGDLYDKEP